MKHTVKYMYIYIYICRTKYTAHKQDNDSLRQPKDLYLIPRPCMSKIAMCNIFLIQKYRDRNTGI